MVYHWHVLQILSACSAHRFFHLLKRLRTQKLISDYEYNGVQQVDEEGRQFITVAALTSYTPESLLGLLLQDSRVAKNTDRLQEAVQAEFAYLEGLSSFPWIVLGQFAGLTAEEARHRVISSALISLAFLDRRIWSVVRTYPWCLCRGDLDEHFAELIDSDVPEDPTAAKLQALLQAGFNRAVLSAGIRMLGECSFTSHATERQHASGSLARKYHSEAGDELIRGKAFMHTFAQLLPGESEDSKRIQRLMKKREAVLRRRPSHITGRHVFLGSVLDKAVQKNRARVGQSQYELKKVVGLHGQEWRNLPPQEQHKYHRQAKRRRTEAERAHRAELQSLDADIAVGLQRRDASVTETSGSMMFSACTLSADALQDLPHLLRDLRNEPSRLRRQRSAAAACPQPLSVAEMESVLAGSVIVQEVAEQASLLSMSIARCRSSFSDCVFGIPEGENHKWYKFVFATKQPARPYLLELTPVEPLLPAPELVNKTTWNQRSALNYSAAWIYDELRTTSQDVFKGVDVYMVLLFPGVKCSSAGLLTARALPLPLGPYLRAVHRDLPPRQEEPGPPRAESSRAKAAVATAGLDWTKLPLGASSSSDGAEGSNRDSASGSRPAQAGKSATDVGSDSDEGHVFAELEAQRAAWGQEDEEDETDWSRISLIGGQWSMVRAGRAAYGFRADVKPKSKAAEFCDGFRVPKSATFDNEVYGEVVGSSLAKLWVAGMTALTRDWVQQGSPSEFDASRTSDFLLPEALRSTLTGLKGKAAKRMSAILSLSP